MFIITNMKSGFLTNDNKFVSFVELDKIKKFTAYITAAEYVSKNNIEGDVITMEYFTKLMLCYYRTGSDEKLFKELRDIIETQEIKLEELTKLNINLVNQINNSSLALKVSRHIPL